MTHSVPNPLDAALRQLVTLADAAGHVDADSITYVDDLLVHLLPNLPVGRRAWHWQRMRTSASRLDRHACGLLPTAQVLGIPSHHRQSYAEDEARWELAHQLLRAEYRKVLDGAMVADMTAARETASE